MGENVTSSQVDRSLPTFKATRLRRVGGPFLLLTAVGLLAGACSDSAVVPGVKAAEPDPDIKIGSEVTTYAGSNLNCVTTFAQPSLKADKVSCIPNGNNAMVVNGPTNSGGLLWWQVKEMSGQPTTGWTEQFFLRRWIKGVVYPTPNPKTSELRSFVAIAPTPNPTPTETAPSPGWIRHKSTGIGYSIDYQPNWSVKEEKNDKGYLQNKFQENIRSNYPPQIVVGSEPTRGKTLDEIMRTAEGEFLQNNQSQVNIVILERNKTKVVGKDAISLKARMTISLLPNRPDLGTSLDMTYTAFIDGGKGWAFFMLNETSQTNRLLPVYNTMVNSIRY